MSSMLQLILEELRHQKEKKEKRYLRPRVIHLVIVMSLVMHLLIVMDLVLRVGILYFVLNFHISIMWT